MIEALKRAGLPGVLLPPESLLYRAVTGCNGLNPMWSLDGCVVGKGVIWYLGHEKSSFIIAMGGCFSWAIGSANPVALFRL